MVDVPLPLGQDEGCVGVGPVAMRDQDQQRRVFALGNESAEVACAPGQDQLAAEDDRDWLGVDRDEGADLVEHGVVDVRLVQDAGADPIQAIPGVADEVAEMTLRPAHGGEGGQPADLRPPARGPRGRPGSGELARGRSQAREQVAIARVPARDLTAEDRGRPARAVHDATGHG